MNERTENLRDIYLEVAGESTVTERQEETVSHDPVGDIDTQLAELVEEIRTEDGFDTQFDTGELVAIVKGYFDGESDRVIADDLGDTGLDKAVKRARVRLYLFRDGDLAAPFDLDRLAHLRDEGYSLRECAERLDVSESTVGDYNRVLTQYQRAEDRGFEYEERFEEVLETATLEDGVSETVREDGLAEAVQGREVDSASL